MPDAAAPSSSDLQSRMEEMRASMTARGTEKGPAGMLQEAILRLLALLMAMLADFRAGRLAPLVAAGGRGEVEPTGGEAERIAHRASGTASSAAISRSAGLRREADQWVECGNAADGMAVSTSVGAPPQAAGPGLAAGLREKSARADTPTPTLPRYAGEGARCVEEGEGGPALYRVGAPSDPLSSARAAGGSIRVTGKH